MPEITTSDGVRINFQIDGRDEDAPLLLSHSLGTSLALWDGQIGEAIYRGFRVIRYDHRGHGGSGTGEGPTSIERIAKDALELLDALQVEKASFCGLSLGGMVGVQLAKDHPRRFARVALCNTAVWMSDKAAWDTRASTAEEAGMAALADGALERGLTTAFRDGNPDETARLRKIIEATDPKGYAAGARAIRDMDLRDRLGLIESPVMVVIGAQDTATTPDQGRYIVERVPGAQKTVLESAHLSNIEKRDEFNAAVFAFLTGERN